MSQSYCPQCGTPVDSSEMFCRSCGANLAGQQTVRQVQPQPAYQQFNANGIDPSWPVKSKVTAGILGILLGGIGIHKFYMGKTGMGILYLLFCWTGIPEIVGLIEGIIYLCASDEEFQLKNHVRIQ